MQDLTALFTNLGGEFLAPPMHVAEKALQTEAYLFDWDGVFNNGVKDGSGTGSVFSEIEAMGLNLLRFGYWLRTGRFPFMGIITGESNLPALQLAQREHFDAVYLKFKNKNEALAHLENVFGIQPDRVAFVFDDVLDLSLAAKVGLRFQVRRSASPLLMQYVQQNGLADYVTGHSGSGHAVREVCELMLGMTGVADTVIRKRAAFDPEYEVYFTNRNRIPSRYFFRDDTGIHENDFASLTHKITGR